MLARDRRLLQFLLGAYVVGMLGMAGFIVIREVSDKLPSIEIVTEIPLPISSYQSFLIKDLDTDKCYYYLGGLKQKDVRIQETVCP